MAKCCTTILLMMGLLMVESVAVAQTPQQRKEDVFTIVEKQPEFPGSSDALVNFLEANLKYPDEARNANAKGRVVVSFIVNRDGSLEDFQWEHDFGLGHGCAEEAIRVAKLMPNWIPGSQSGRTQRVKYRQVIWFPVAENRKWLLKKQFDRSVIHPVPPDEKFVNYERHPEFPGGMTALESFLRQHVQYPGEAAKAKVQGRVFVNFVIDTLGQVGQVRVLKGLGYGCDEEAIRVLKFMPNWIPGQQRGKKVNVEYNLPILFPQEPVAPLKRH